MIFLLEMLGEIHIWPLTRRRRIFVVIYTQLLQKKAIFWWFASKINEQLKKWAKDGDSSRGKQKGKLLCFRVTSLKRMMHQAWFFANLFWAITKNCFSPERIDRIEQKVVQNEAGHQENMWLNCGYKPRFVVNLPRLQSGGHFQKAGQPVCRDQQ